VTAVGKQCFYFDVSKCQQEAVTLGGMCIPNEQRHENRSLGASIKPSVGGAPFCVVTALGKQCFYFDVSQCQQEAVTLGGMCIPNEQRHENRSLGTSIKPSVGVAPFCVVNVNGRHCWYYQVELCKQQAVAMQGMCVPN